MIYLCWFFYFRASVLIQYWKVVWDFVENQFIQIYFLTKLLQFKIRYYVAFAFIDIDYNS